MGVLNQKGYVMRYKQLMKYEVSKRLITHLRNFGTSLPIEMELKHNSKMSVVTGDTDGNINIVTLYNTFTTLEVLDKDEETRLSYKFMMNQQLLATHKEQNDD